MGKSALLTIDSIINLVLGFLLLFFPTAIVDILGVPKTAQTFYPSILGSVLIGIGIALIIELRSARSPGKGLGLNGAIAINVCGGIVLAMWLLAGDLVLPLRGLIFLWSLVTILIGISLFELFHIRSAS